MLVQGRGLVSHSHAGSDTESDAMWTLGPKHHCCCETSLDAEI